MEIRWRVCAGELICLRKGEGLETQEVEFPTKFQDCSLEVLRFGEAELEGSMKAV